AMISIYNEFNQRNLKSKMILQVHDELVFDVFKPELDIIMEIVVNEMKNSLKLNLPIEVEVNTGENWLEAH
ncbi:MAG: DNA polymerase, partial [Bacteroidales bacterium]